MVCAALKKRRFENEPARGLCPCAMYKRNSWATNELI